MGKLEQGANTGFSAYKRWEARFAAITVTLAVLLLASMVASASSLQKPAPTVKAPTSVPATPVPPKTNAAQKPKNSPGAKPGLKKRPNWRVLVISDVPIPSVSVHAKRAPLSDVAAEISRQLNIPIVLTPSMKERQLTTDFENFPVEAAAKLLAPRVIIDYIINGGNGPLPFKKEPKAIYLMAYDERPPRQGPWTENRSGSQMIVGMLYATEEEEKTALEIKERDLQVTFKDNLFTVKVQKQYLTDVLQEIALKAKIPFAILTTDRTQREIDEVVTWNISDATLEDLARTWFPNAIRLYWRTDLESFESTPIRLTIEQNSGVQAEQRAEPKTTP